MSLMQKFEEQGLSGRQRLSFEEYGKVGISAELLTDRIAPLVSTWSEWHEEPMSNLHETDEQARVLGVMVFGKDGVRAVDVERFVEVINHVVDTGLFQKRRWGPVFTIKSFESKDVNAWTMLLYGYSSFSVEWLNKILGARVVINNADPIPGVWPPFVAVKILSDQLDAQENETSSPLKRIK